ncbi:MAG TPA: DUF692 family protein [Sphingomonas sp.]|nr:DUF692 family protein [Sphingomonas sp.]
MIFNLAAERFARSAGAIDYLAITPDMFWTDAGPGAPDRFGDLDRWVAMLEWAQPRLPIVAHHIGLSIASAREPDLEYVDQMAAWHSRWHYEWLSDHLSFIQVGDEPQTTGAAGLALPPPYDEELLALVGTRMRAIRERTGAPFLIENSPQYVVYPDQDMREAAFLNRLCDESGGGLLLDLHNLHVNAVNHRFDADEFLDELALENVVEVHIAGGSMVAGLYADSHSGTVPEPVWRLLDRVLPRAPNVRGVTFEFHDSYFEVMGGDRGLADQIGRARAAWARHA